MDVNNIRQNAINLYSNNANISQYTQTDIDVAVQQVQQTQKDDGTQKEKSDNEDKQINKKDVEQAVKKINDFLKDEHTRAEFSYDKELKATSIKIIDEDTKEVILEVPPKKILDMVASMMRQVGLLDKKA
ncbi:flagellar protein FlaG [Clostridium beijerinckii]|uniref:flagellar protein FlaG n=1 Tax=Clostridium beijerinckii TaxID=1520 RepID=UPI00047D3145|nr:flagellar protein FlaG [Clostridium beijerinckii]